MSSDKRIEELEQQLKQMQDSLFQMAKMAELGKLIAVTAHELSQPLLGIKAFAQILQRRCKQDDFVSTKIRIIVQQAKVMEGILDNLRQFSRQEAIQAQAVDLTEVVGRVTDLFKERSRKGQVQIAVSTPDSLARVQGTPGHLQQVVANLFSNALDSLESVPRGRIQINLADEGDFVVLRIADSGCGVPDQAKRHMFESFYTTKGADKGTGLGLSICREIVTAYGGEIRLMNPDEIDSCFGDDFNTAFEVRLQKALELHVDSKAQSE